MRTVRQICAIAFLTAAFSTFALGEEGWIGTGNKPPQPAPLMTTSQQTPEPGIAEIGEGSGFFDELYVETLIFLQMNLL